MVCIHDTYSNTSTSQEPQQWISLLRVPSCRSASLLCSALPRYLSKLIPGNDTDSSTRILLLFNSEGAARAPAKILARC